MKKIVSNYLFGIKNPTLPSYLTFYVNNICQLRCDMCFYWDSMQKKTIQLTTDQIEKLAKSLPNLIQLSITGGEPTLRKDLPEVVKIFCSTSNVAKCSIITNGFITSRVIEMAKKILDENSQTSFRFCISIDGNKDLHNRIRGVKNSFENAIVSFKELKKLKNQFQNLHVDINTTVSKYNYKNFSEFSEFVNKDLDPDHHTVTITRGKTKEQDAGDIPLEEIKRIYTSIKNRNKNHKKIEHKLINALRSTMYTEIERIFSEDKFKYYCTAGKKYITVYQDGKVAACEILDTLHPEQSAELGNLNDFNFNIVDLLRTKKSNDRVSWIKDNKCFCSFECAKSNDVVFNKKLAIKTLLNIL